MEKQNVAPTTCLNKEKTTQKEINNRIVEYIEKGEKDKPSLILLPGTAGDARIFCKIIKPLSKNFHVYSFSHIHVKGVKNVVETWNYILHSLKINIPFSMLGTSVGGRIIQYYAERYPQDVNKIILANTYSDNKEIISKNKGSIFLVNFIPLSIIKKILLKGTAESFKNHPEYDEIITYFKNNLEKETRKKLLIRLRWNFEKLPLPKISQNISKLIIISNDDPLIPSKTREKLLKQYPEAKVKKFKSGGHFLYLTKAEEYFMSVKNFLLEK